MPGAANEDFYTNSNCLLEARGFQWANAAHGERRRLETTTLPAAPGGYAYERNGGLIVRRRVEVAADTRLMRFAAASARGRALTPDDWMNSPWWLTEDRFVLLLDRARTAAVPLVEMARRQLAIPADWSTMDRVVCARPRAPLLLACYAGPGQTAATAGETRIIAHEAKTLWMEQLYIPGLGRMPWLFTPPPNAARLWLDYERDYDAKARGFG